MGKCLVVVMLFLVNNLFAQLPDGDYSYENKDTRLNFTISGDGQNIDECSFSNMVLLKRFKGMGSGEFSSDTLTKSVYNGYYVVKGSFPDFSIKVKGKSIDLISIDIPDVKMLKTFNNTRFIPK